jgi:hypothetical protein
MTTDLTRPERLQIMLSAEELKAVDDWRFKQRMPTRAAAVRELLRSGLMAVGAMPAGQGAKSTDYGVIGRTAETHGAANGNGHIAGDGDDRNHEDA